MERKEAAHLSWEEVRDLAAGGAAALIPVGATEAHGPHLPLGTDVQIAEEVARRSAKGLAAKGIASVIFPSLAYGVTDFAAGFPGTVTIGAATLEALAAEIASSLLGQGFQPVVFLNHHLEPAHFEALQRAAEGLAPAPVLVPDHRQKPWALELGEEFCRGGSHAGSYETSLVLAAEGGALRVEPEGLPVLDLNLGKAIRAGARSFHELGAERAYLGDPAAGTAAEGERLYQVLVDLVVGMVERAAKK